MNRAQLNDLIATHLRRGSGGDIRDIAVDVADMVPDDDLRDVLAVTMREYVRAYVGLQRVATLAPYSPAAQNAGKLSGVGRPRRAIAVDAWRRRLAVMVSVADNKVKPLGQLTVDEVEHQIAKLGGQLTALEIRHDWYTAIAKAMREYGVERVADLPENVLSALLDREAA